MGDILYTSEVDKRFRRMRCDGKPALVFAAHLANWELPALVAAKFRLEATVLYREPNIGAVSDAIIQIRKGSMGTLVPTGLDAPIKLLRVLEAGGHVAMVVDQHYVNGVDVTFFGIDVEGTMQAITSVIEGWVREYPEQWLWVHRRWR